MAAQVTGGLVMPEDLNRATGRLEARMDAQEKRAADMQIKLDAIHDWMKEARGSWKTMVAIGGAAAAVGAAVGKILAFLFQNHG